ncbi:MAG: cadherin-like beta sandwich domain-containing protein [Gammaproteobacteria bacterium]|jgi:hypothetical protein|nr:cadherin-like beta sandwich domain-containing protein [Gammaproteobacteria bacterium]
MTPIRLLVLVLAAAQIAACAMIQPAETDPDADVEAFPRPAAIPTPVPVPEARTEETTEEAKAPPDTKLAALSISPGALDQAFQAGQDTYTGSQGFLVSRLAVTARTADPAAGVGITGAASQPGRARLTLPLGVGDNLIPIVVTASDGESRQTWHLTINRAAPETLAERRYLKASNADRNDLFGYALAADGDLLAVGAYLEGSYAGGVNGDQTDNSAEGSGAVYVFSRHGNDWVQQAYLKGLANGGGQQFGRTLALSGNTLAVGAPFDRHGGSGIDPAPAEGPAPDSGAVHLFRLRDGVWEREAYIKAVKVENGALFGYSVALQGDTLAVGAYLEDAPAGGPADSGAVHVFQRVEGNWTPSAHLLASPPQKGAGFGYSMAVSGATLAAGAHLEAGSGAVHLFSREGERWLPQTVLRGARPGSNDLFGSSLALDDDTLAVGAHLEDGAFENSGAVYVYHRQRGEWSDPLRLEPEGGAEHRFGRSLALDGDTLVIGAYLEDSAETGIHIDEAPESAERAAESGAIYVYTRDDTGWTKRAHIKSGNAEAGDMFGYAVSLTGGVLAAGAPAEAAAGTDPSDNRAVGAGAVYLFR